MSWPFYTISFSTDPEHERPDRPAASHTLITEAEWDAMLAEVESAARQSPAMGRLLTAMRRSEAQRAEVVGILSADPMREIREVLGRAHPENEGTA